MKPNYISDTDWQLVNSICNSNPQEPYLIAAIGWHETHWGTIGAGVGGWHLGYGYYGNPIVAAKYKGLEKQLKGAHSMILAHFKFPVTLESTTEFAVNHWKSSVPTAWAKSVYAKFISITKETTMNPNDLLTPNFRFKEFFCQGITPPPDDMFQDILMLAIELQKVRSFLGKPIYVTSGYRTKEYNDYLIKQGYPASANSYHMKGMAVDSKVNSISTRDYALYLMHLTNFMSVGIGSGFVHTDLRDNFTIIHY